MTVHRIFFSLMARFCSSVAAILFCSFLSFSLSAQDLPVGMQPANSSEEESLRMFTPAEDYFLPSGYQVKATIQNAIFSFNLVTPVIAIVDDPAVCPKNGNVIFPRKTRLIGTADILKSDDRVNIRFLVAVLPDGAEFVIGALALSPDGSAGIKGIVKEYKDTRLITSAMSGALLGVGQGVAFTMAGQPIAGQAIGGALQQASQQIAEIGSQRVDVSISVPPFQKTLVFLMNRLSLDDRIPGKEATKEPKQEEQKPEEQKRKNWREQ